MLKFKSRLTKLQKQELMLMVNEIEDIWGEFYITKQNLRLYIAQNQDVFFDSLKKGNKIIYNKEAIIYITGFSDGFARHYIKFLYKSLNNIDSLLKQINWDISCDLFAKIKKNNPLIEILKKYDFEYFKDRGKEILLARKNIKEEK